MHPDVNASGTLLRGYRHAAGLTQEELAERAGLSVRGLSDLERGVRRLAYRDTVHRLADALRLSPAELDALLSAAGGGERPAQSSANSTATDLPIPLTTFVGRAGELALRVFLSVAR